MSVIVLLFVSSKDFYNDMFCCRGLLWRWWPGN